MLRTTQASSHTVNGTLSRMFAPEKSTSMTTRQQMTIAPPDALYWRDWGLRQIPFLPSWMSHPRRSAPNRCDLPNAGVVTAYDGVAAKRLHHATLPNITSKWDRS